MSEFDQERQAEQQRVHHVMEEIDKRMAELEQRVGTLREDIVDIRRNFWDDVTVNLDDAHEAVETYISIRQQAEVLSERERSHRHAELQLKTLRRLRQSPYFGRIDFTESGQKQTERIYLGIGSLLDNDEVSFLIYDWRAPVASMYYDYAPGPAEYETPSGTITGTMERKRQYIIRDGEIRSMFDTGVTIGDELLQEVLGKQASTQMKSIVATIQKEQNRIIRNERSRLLVVQGAAGSGKTSAALQRVAYLLYRYRNTLRADQIVLFSPNPLFNSYISTVLPELGEENMQQTTFQEYLERRLGNRFRLEDAFAQLEYVHTASHEPGYQARMAGIRYKASAAFLQVMDRYLEHLGKTGLPFRDLVFRDRVLISAERITEKFASLDASVRIPNRVRLVAEWLLEELEVRARIESKKQWVEDEVELLDQDDFRQAYQQLRKQKRMSGSTFDDSIREQKWLAALVVNRHFEPLRASVKQLQFLDIPAAYRQLFSEWNRFFPSDQVHALPSEWKEICRQTIERLDRGEMSYEDATPYLYLQDRLEGFRTHTAVRHVFLDEAQDYSPFQFAFLKRLFPHSKFTVLGDFNQAIYAHASGSSFDEVTALFEPEQTEKIVLTRSYRSTRPIVEFTRAMVPGGEAIEPFQREGSKPTVTPASNQRELADLIVRRIGQLRANGHRTIAVIGKSFAECQEAYAALRDHVQIRLINKETVSFAEGVLVIPSYLAKGVEFDAVIAYNASALQYGQESERRLFYTVCTRAMHELHLYTIGPVSPFVRELSPALYESNQ